MLADYHVHCYYSDDSEYPMEEVVCDAIKKGVSELCFTDHVDYGIKRDWDDPLGIEIRHGGPGEPEINYMANVDYPKYFAEIETLQEKYRQQITIKKGLEFGIQMHTIAQYEQLYQKYPMDFILLSIHQIHDQEFWTGEFQKGKTQKEYNFEYYQQLLNIIQNFKHYSVLAHMDLIVRYDAMGIYPFEELKPILTEILQTVIRDEKGIELNTSYHRYGLKDSMPSRNILKLYHDLGGRIITIGSDSHKPEHLAAYIGEAKKLLMELGYQQYCTFENMKPIFHDLSED